MLLYVYKRDIVIYTSDNGPENTWRERIRKFDHHSAGPYRGGKRSVYEGGHRVPFFLRWPDQVKPGSHCREPICQTDLLATFADILGQPLPGNAAEDSISFRQAWHGSAGQSSARDPIIHHGANGRFAIRKDHWKLIMESRKKGEQRELYNLETDPSEKHNVLATNPGVEKVLLALLIDIVTSGSTRDGATTKNCLLYTSPSPRD